MAQVNLVINGRTYPVQCPDGEEGRLQDLGKYLDHHVQELVSGMGQVGEAQLLLLAGLTIADELADAIDKAEADETRTAGEAAKAVEARAAGILGDAAAKVEDIAARLETA